MSPRIQVARYRIGLGVLIVLAGVVLLAVGFLLPSSNRDPRAESNNHTPASRPLSSESDAFVLRPGEGVGGVPFGASRDSILSAFGSPAVSKNADPFHILEYPNYGFWVLCHAEKGFLQVNCFDGSRARVIGGNISYSGKTVEGLGIGSSKEDVRSAMGDPVGDLQEDSWSNRSPQISFGFKDNVVEGISMTWRGTGPPK